MEIKEKIMKNNNSIKQFLENFHKKNFFPIFENLKKEFPKIEIYLVGGAVRDIFLKRKIKDYDFVVKNISLEKLAQFLKKFGKVDFVGKTFGVLKINTKKGEKPIEIALPRLEIPEGRGGYKDVEVKTDPNLEIEEDLKRRDFTINAMALSLKGKLIDPFNGLKDLKNRLIRAVGDPEKRFKEDASRILRAIRFASQLNFQIEEGTFESLKKNIDLLFKEDEKGKIVPYEVIASEFLKAFYYHPLKSLELYDQIKILEKLIPEILKMKNCPQPKEYHSEGDVWTHTKLALKNLFSQEFKQEFGQEKPNIELIIAVLFHDLGKPYTIKTPEKDKVERIRFDGHDKIGASLAKKICQRLKLSSPEEIKIDPEKIYWLIKNHMIFITADLEKIKPTTIEKYFFHPQNPGDNLLKLGFVDGLSSLSLNGKPHLSSYYKMKEKIKEIEKLADEKRNLPKPLLNGYEIMEKFNLKPGPKIGQLKEILREAQLRKKIKTKSEAIKYLKKYQQTD